MKRCPISRGELRLTDEFRRIRALALAFFFVSSEAAAQQNEASLPSAITHSIGSTVRIHSAGDGVLEGRLAGVRLDSLVLVTLEGQRLTQFARSDTLWVRERPVVAGAVIGGITGLAIIGSFLALVATICGSGDDPCTGFGSPKAIGFYITTTAACAAFGAAVGLAASHWRQRYP
jgi:hypothetical protein